MCDRYRRSENRIGAASEVGKLYRACCNEPAETEIDACGAVAKLIEFSPAFTRQQFENEIKLQQLAGDVAPRIFMSEANDHNGMVVMERMPLSFEDIMGSMRPAEMAEKIGALIRRLHSQGILHNDVHTGNIMATRDGTFKLIDFGKAVLKTPSIKEIEQEYKFLRLRSDRPFYSEFRPVIERVLEEEIDEILESLTFGRRKRMKSVKKSAGKARKAGKAVKKSVKAGKKSGRKVRKVRKTGKTGK